MNTPVTEERQQPLVAPDAPLANRVRSNDERPVRQVRRRLSFEDVDLKEGNETHWRIQVYQVEVVHGLPVHTSKQITVELFDSPHATYASFNEAVDTGRLARGSRVHADLLAHGHVSRNINDGNEPADFETYEEYRRNILESFRAITYIKM